MRACACAVLNIHFSLLIHTRVYFCIVVCVCVCVRAQGRLQDGERAEERGQQEVRLQRRPAPHLPQTVQTSRRQLRIDTLTLSLRSCTGCFVLRLVFLIM